MPVFLSIKRNRNYQNKGIGSRLLVTAIEHSKAHGCTQIKGWMHGDKVRLERFYRSFGFEISGICSGQQIPDTDLSRFSAFTGDSPSFA
ncbi:GNAT family N-acetyltransferase [Vibrio splendidus]|uniref:GNAT family N-acetyltransferase n=1 Tax=Vibrio splendidus TaxID=29497 RepID=UPI001E2DE782|nr:GNAT family N-acetyltransferase [Vibrio splendidus]